MDPLSTPLSTSAHKNVAPLTNTPCLRFVKKDVIQSNSLPEIPNAFSLVKIKIPEIPQ